jgi:hypothetical protein
MAVVRVAGVCDQRDYSPAQNGRGAHFYAWRYALFTLVGIVGEDDLDAPEPSAGPSLDPSAGLDVQTSTNPMADEPPFAASDASRKGKVIRAPRIVLATDQSEAVRDRLVAELVDLKSADDADAVEAGFREKLAMIDAASAARQEQLHSAPAENPEPPVGQPFITMSKRHGLNGPENPSLVFRLRLRCSLRAV